MKLPLKLTLLVVFIFVCSLGIWFVFSDASNWNLPSGYPNKIVPLSDIIYFTATTVSTAGFGDFTGNTPAFRNFVIFILLGAYTIMNL